MILITELLSRLAARIQAAAILLDRGWGRPTQPHTGEDGDVRVTIRNITETKS